MSENKTHGEIIEEMRFHGQLNIDAEQDKPEFGVLTVEGKIIKNYADQLEAAYKREVGNIAKLRNALELSKVAILVAKEKMNLENPIILEIIDEALAAPARQCDRYTGDDLDRDVDDAYASANKDLMVDYDREDLPIRWLLSTDAQVEAYKKKFKEELELLGKAWRGEK